VSLKLWKSERAIVLLLAVSVFAMLRADDSLWTPCEAIVSLNQGTIVMPEGTTCAALESVSVTVPKVLGVLEDFGAESVGLAFPDFEASDTLRVSLSGETVKLPDLRSIFYVRFPAGTDIDSVCTDLTAIPQVKFADPEAGIEPFVVPDDPFFPDQWYLQHENGIGINAPDAWDVTRGDPSTYIAVIDGGVQAEHPDLQGKVSGNTGISPHRDWRGHGCLVAGIAAANTSNGIGISGVDWNARIISARVDEADMEASHPTVAIADTIMHLLLARSPFPCVPHVANMSWGYVHGTEGDTFRPYQHLLRIVLGSAYRLGVLSVAATGNNASETPRYPAAYGMIRDGSNEDRVGVVVAVGATDADDDWWDYYENNSHYGSNYGHYLDVVAPGTQILSSYLYPDSQYKTATGTSLAAPQVAGLAGLLHAMNPDLTNDDIRWIIRISAAWVAEMGNHEWTEKHGDGRIDARMAVNLALHEVSHASTKGGWSISETDPYRMDFPLREKESRQDGWLVRRYTVQTTVSTPDAVSRGVWGRKETVGWSKGEREKYHQDTIKQFEEGWCRVADQESTLTTLETYAYKVLKIDTLGVTYGDTMWWPAKPSDVEFHYTVLIPPPAWQVRSDVPLGTKNRRVKDGGSLAGTFVPDSSREYVYALKGNNTCEFFRYDLQSGTWSSRESLPVVGGTGVAKRVKKGGCLASVSDGRLFALKGNNTREFWRYDPGQSGYKWQEMSAVPPGASEKPVREGASLAAVRIGSSDYVYMLKGSNTREFFRYDVAANTWATMASPSAGPYGKNFKNGSCLAYDGVDTIYALKGATNEFSAYCISSNTWLARETMPRLGASGRKRPAHYGTSLAHQSDAIYALKGSRTNDFFTYRSDGDTWELAPSLPSNGSRGVSGGGALAAIGGLVWALRGCNTLDFLRFTPGFEQGALAGQGGSSPGANEVQIAACANATATTPRWSPDGSWVAFCRNDQSQCQYSQVFKAPANGGQTTELTSLSGDCSNPVWSPNDSSIAFEYESGGYTQVAIVPSSGGQVTVLSSDACDHERPEWSSGGDGLFYSRLDSTGYTQVYYVSSSGGSEQAKSSTSYAHEKPQVLSNTEVICVRDGDDVYTGICKLNVNTGQEVALTSGSADYSNPSVAAGARLVACEKVDQDGYSQIVVFSADGGTETVVTSGSYDFESPSICYDGSVVSCIRVGSSGSAVCVIDLLEGTCQVFTDALADRESPDAHALSSAQHLVSTAYIREGDVYRVDYITNSGVVIAPEDFRAGIARDPNGYVHSVYSDGTLIRHKVQDQTGTCIRQDTPGYGDSPSLSMSIAGDAVVVCRKGDSIFGAVQRANNSWKRVLLYSAPASHHVGPPASAAFQVLSGRFINACVPCYDSSLGSSMILFLQADTVPGNVVLDTLDLCTGSCADSSVCMTVNSASFAIEAAYVRSESVFYRSVHFSPTDSMRPIPWTGPSKVNDSATTGRNPVCERRNGRFYVAFTESWIDSASSNPVWSIVRASCCDTVPTVTWEGRGPVSSVDGARKGYASLSRTHTAWAESSSTLNRWLIKANIADSQVTLSPDTSCVSCALLCDSTVLARPATAMTRLRLVWLQKYGNSGDTWMVPNIEREIYDASASANVTRYNQGRKLCLDSTGSSTDSIRVVFRSNQSSLWIARKKDGDETWTSSLLRNSGDMPAIDQSQGRIWVCDRDVSTVPPGNVIRCQNRAIGSSAWHDFQVYFTANPNPANSRLGPPAIVASLNDTSGQNRSAAYIIFTAYTPSPPKSAVVICKVDTGGNILWTDTLHSVSSLTDSFADVAAHPVAGQGYGLHATWGQVGTIQYRKTTNLDQPEFTLKRVWSPSYSVSTGPTLRHSVVAASAETVLVAFVVGDSGRIMTRGQAPGSNYNVWDDTVNISQCPDTVADWPSIAPLTPGESTVVSYQKRLSSTNYDVMARVNFHGSINLSNTAGANSKYPHVAFHLHNDSFPVVTAIWTEEQSTTTAEVGYKRWQLGLDGGGGIQDFSIFDPNIHPALFAPAPNPFNGLARIHFQTNIRGMTKVSVMDITGRRVRNLLCMPMKPGVYNLTWNARDDRERKLAGGVYFVRLETPNYHETRKVILTE